MPFRATTALLAFSILVAGQAEALAKTAFDGSWRVTASTTQGNCESVVHYRIVIIDGRVMSGDITGVSGQVGASGNVSVRVTRKEGTALGSGRLAGNSGSGSWTVRSPSRQCAGTWTADRVP